MCGIAGLIASPDARVSLVEAGNRMQASLQHRGPDSNGMWKDENAGLLLVHTRLAIQDLSEHGHQPMRSSTGRYCIVFNGEIYNFREIAAELGSAGHVFTGHSDTEVLLCAIEEWGLETAVRRALGMFAFALWDTRNRHLSLCRDRLGEKPLYYGWLGNCFYFASELKAIDSVAPKSTLSLDPQGLTNYLRYGYITAPHSIYRGIYKLIPGTIFTFPAENIHERTRYSPCADTAYQGPRTYWSVYDAACAGLANPIDCINEATKELDLLLQNTVQLQKIADVDVGVFLSGGIDSSTVAAVAQNGSTDRIRTFSIGFNEKEFDESVHAEKIARHIGSDHSTMYVSSRDTLEIIPDLPGIFDEPFADSSQIPTYIVSRFARSEVTVCLSGDGGDELFAGYNRYLSTDRIWKQLRHLPYPVRKLLGKILALPDPGVWNHLYNGLHTAPAHGQEKQKLVGLKVQKLAGLLQQPGIMRGYDYLMSYWHNPEELVSMENAQGISCTAPTLPGDPSFIDKAMFLDQTAYLQGDNLTKVDRASMAVSLETRLPLLSHKMVELAWRIPVSMKVRSHQSKWILRQVLYNYVPRELVERPKMGFSVPVAEWLRGDLKEWASDLLALLGKDEYSFIDAKNIHSAWRTHLAGKYDHSQRLWTILMLLSWQHNRT